MTREEKELLIKDLCARLPYGVKIQTPRGIYTVDAVSSEGLFSIPNSDKTLDDLTPHDGHYWLPITDDYKPYLRPMSSMTEKEREACADFIYKQSNESCWIDEYGSLNLYGGNEFIDAYTFSCYLDWLNEYHFDFRGLIEKSLALPATKDMYK